MKIKEAARKTRSEWSVSELDLRKDPLFQLKPVRFKKKIRVSESTGSSTVPSSPRTAFIDTS